MPGTASPASAAVHPAATSLPIAASWEPWARHFAAAPFDALRAQYAGAVRAGVLAPSLLAASRFERVVAQWESWTLGPWARHR